MNDNEFPKRSEHSEKRREEGRRVAPAFNDAQKAKQSDVFIQLDGRYVVRGKMGREHIFEHDGELVTSIDRSHKAHLLKIKKGQRQLITEKQFQEFKRIFL